MNDLIRSVARIGRATIVRLGGEIDLYRSPSFHEALVALCDEGPERLIVHLSDVEYIDSSGVGSLVEIFRRLKRLDRKLILVAPSERVNGVLEITKLDRFFPIVGSEEEGSEMVTGASGVVDDRSTFVERIRPDSQRGTGRRHALESVLEVPLGMRAGGTP